MVINRISGSVLAVLLSLSGHAVAAERQNTGQQSAPFPDHTAIPEIIGTPIRESAHPHYVWTTNEEAVLQLHFTGPGGIDFINPADDPRKK